MYVCAHTVVPPAGSGSTRSQGPPACCPRGWRRLPHPCPPGPLRVSSIVFNFLPSPRSATTGWRFKVWPRLSRRFWHVLGQWILSTIPTVEAGPPRPGVGARPLRAHYSKVSPPIPPRLAETVSPFLSWSFRVSRAWI